MKAGFDSNSVVIGSGALSAGIGKAEVSPFWRSALLVPLERFA